MYVGGETLSPTLHFLSRNLIGPTFLLWLIRVGVAPLTRSEGTTREYSCWNGLLVACPILPLSPPIVAEGLTRAVTQAKGLLLFPWMSMEFRLTPLPMCDTHSGIESGTMGTGCLSVARASSFADGSIHHFLQMGEFRLRSQRGLLLRRTWSVSTVPFPGWAGFLGPCPWVRIVTARAVLSTIWEWVGSWEVVGLVGWLVDIWLVHRSGA